MAERSRPSLSERQSALTTGRLTLCGACLAGEGGVCHTPGCALWMNRAPDVPIAFEHDEVEQALLDVVFTPDGSVPDRLAKAEGALGRRLSS